jgi:polar amino acid transport system substrate-binding protein
VWCGDQEGGGPYVYPADDDPGRVVGFEVELASLLAAQLGLEAQFFQGQWDRLPELVRARKCDIVLNGYEWAPALLEAMQATIPYYVYRLQLLVRSDGDVRGWADLERGGRKVGVLGGSAAEKYLRDRFDGRLEIVSYDGSTDSMREVETKKLDATLQDAPAATFYLPRFPNLRSAGSPLGGGYYVIYARKREANLVHVLNEAIADLIRTGKLEQILRTYRIWDESQQELLEIARAGRFYGYPTNDSVPRVWEAGSAEPVGAVQVAEKKHGWAVVRAYGPILLQSAGVTLVLACLSFPLAVGGGLLIALGRLYGPAWLKVPLAGYVEFLRGTPVMLQLYFVFFFLPEMGINVPAFLTAILGLAINYSAYESEIYRAGLLAVPKAQMEAALALGMTRPLALRRVVVPQAMRIVVPPVVSDFIALFKDTSVCSVVTVVELTKRFSILSQSTQSTVELMLLTGALYLAMSYPLSLLSRRLELRQEGALA